LLKNKKKLKKGNFKNVTNHKIETFLFSFKNVLPTDDDDDDDELLRKKVKTEAEKVNINYNSFHRLNYFFRLKKMKLILNG